MFCGTRPCSIFRSKASSAASTRVMPMPASACDEERGRERRSDGMKARSCGVSAQRARSRANVRDPIEHPSGIVGRSDQRRVADGRPHQSPELVGETGDRIPCRHRGRVDAERKPAIPGEILELYRAQEDRGIEAFERIEPDILYPGRILDTDVFALDRVARNHGVATCREAGDEVALQVDSLDGTVVDGRSPAGGRRPAHVRAWRRRRPSRREAGRHETSRIAQPRRSDPPIRRAAAAQQDRRRLLPRSRRPSSGPPYTSAGGPDASSQCVLARTFKRAQRGRGG